MALSLNQRSVFYGEFGKLLNAGFPFLKAVETLLSARGGAGLHGVLQRLRDAARRGSDVAGAFAEPGMPFDAMEISLMAACERSGQMVRGCGILQDYFSRLAETRGKVIRKSAYPVFVLHFGILMLAVPKFFQGGSAMQVLLGIGATLAFFYLGAAAIWFFFLTLHRLADRSVTMERLFQWVPILGGVRRSLSLARFCTTYHMQLDAGVNVMDSLHAAGAASQSASIRGAIEQVLPGIRQGGQVGAELAATRVFPEILVRALVIGEQTGSLDEELTRASAEYDQRAIRGIETLGDWLPKLIYFAIVLFLAWKIVGTFRDSLQGMEKMIDI